MNDPLTNDPSKPGAILAQERLRQNLTVNDVANKLRISIRQIEAMEAWLKHDAGKLVAMQPEIERTVWELEARALPATAAAWRRMWRWRRVRRRSVLWRSHSSRGFCGAPRGRKTAGT